MGISNRFSVLNNLIYHAAQWGMLKQETLDATQEDLRTKTIEKKYCGKYSENHGCMF